MPLAVVAGAVANKPGNGGEAWVRLNWLLGLRRLGWEVLFVEVVSERPEPVALVHLQAAMAEHGLGGRWALLGTDGESLAGLPREGVEGLVADAEVLFNHSGHLGPGTLRESPRLRVYVDLDPGYTQVWAADPTLAFTLAGHDRHVTVGLRVGEDGCALPTAGVDWVPTLPPVVLECWPAAPPADPGPLRFTTVSTWRNSYGPLALAGEVAGGKHQEFRRLLPLPGGVPEASFELALDIDPGDAADLVSLRAAGWSVADPRAVASTPAAFGSYLRGSGAEFSVAQGAYVASRSGWFSDRTAAYLASGRPVLVQDTGVGDRLPIGEGLITFTGLADAEEGARRLVADPIGHGEAARDLARTHLDSDLVLGHLLERLGLSAAVA